MPDRHSHSPGTDKDRRLLLLLVTILTQALLTLVRCNLMAFTLLTAWHSLIIFRYPMPLVPWLQVRDHLAARRLPTSTV